jgi:hypothetical protein
VLVPWDQANRKTDETVILDDVLNSLSCGGLIRNISEPDVLRRCLEFLGDLEAEFDRRGFDSEEDIPHLRRIYGTSNGDDLLENLCDEYETWQYTSEVKEEERATQGYASPEQCRMNVLESIRREISRLQTYQKKCLRMERIRAQVEVAAANVPDVGVLDRLLRAEASLNREFARTLDQLERIQRARLGQPLPPRIEVDIKK